MRVLLRANIHKSFNILQQVCCGRIKNSVTIDEPCVTLIVFVVMFFDAVLPQ
jgi:hypothetical protein